MSEPSDDTPTASSKPNTAADDAFAALGNATRLRTLETLARRDTPATFTELFEASDADTTAGFAYHLRQLTDRFVRKREGDDADTPDRYTLTYAGRAAARALAAGTYTDQVAREPEPVEGTCPACGTAALEAGVTDNHVSVACTACGADLFGLPMPPRGLQERPLDETLDVLDSYHRARLDLLADGVCPDCAGVAEGQITFADRGGEEAVPQPAITWTCGDCGFRFRGPVTLAVLEHPDVRAFAREQGLDLADRPLWDLGGDWHAVVLSEDPPAVRVVLDVDGERVRALVGNGPTVVEVERGEAPAAEPDEPAQPDGETAEGGQGVDA